MKTKEELNALKAEFEALNRKLAELTEDELEQVTGGMQILCMPDECRKCAKTNCPSRLPPQATDPINKY